MKNNSTIVFSYNLFQIVTWGVIMIWSLYELLVTPLTSFLYHDNALWRGILQVA